MKRIIKMMLHPVGSAAKNIVIQNLPNWEIGFSVKAGEGNGITKNV